VFANALDDIDDGITHVLRGEDHLANVPKQMLIRRALGYEPPVWAHLPMIVNAQRKKLSKRRDKLALAAYQDEGYLAEAMVNYLATLGWSPGGDDEIATLPEMVTAFELASVNSSPAMFDTKKLDAFNGHYIRELPVDELVARAKPFYDGPALVPMAEEVRTRVTRLDQIGALISFIDEPTITIDPEALVRVQKLGPAAIEIVEDVAAVLATTPWEADALLEAVRAVGEARGLALRKLDAPVRVAVSGKTVGPPLFEALVVLGRDRTLERLAAFEDLLAES